MVPVLLSAPLPLLLFAGALAMIWPARRYLLCAFCSAAFTAAGVLAALVWEVPLEEVATALLVLTAAVLYPFYKDNTTQHRGGGQ